MNSDSTESLIKLAIAGAVGYFAYNYLQTSGLWAQWFGASSSAITTTAQLQAYCTANPTGSATFNGSTTTCTAWLQAIAAQAAPANSSPATTGTSTTTTTPPSTSINQSVLTQLVNDMGSSTANLDQWNYYYVKIVPGSNALDPSQINIQRNSDNSLPASGTMSATQYLQYRSSKGLSSLPGSPFARPYAFGRPN